MTRAYFRLAPVNPYDQVRVDTTSTTDSPADIRTTDQTLIIPGSILRADPYGALPDVLGPDDGTTTLFLKTVGQNGSVPSGGTSNTGNTGTGTAQTTLDTEGIEDIVGGALGDGLGYDDTGDRINVRFSTDGNNAARLGSDGGIYTPVVTGGGGSGGGPQSYKYTQSTPAAVWTITHALGFDPGGQTVIDTDGYVRDGFGVQVITTGQTLRLSFDVAVSGTAYLS